MLLVMLAMFNIGPTTSLRKSRQLLLATAKIRAYALQAQGVDTLDANLELGLPADARDYSIAAEMLKMEQIDNVQLMTNNPKKVKGLENHGITVTNRVPHEIISIPENDFYLHTKADRMGHIMSFNGSAQEVRKTERIK